MTSSTARSSRCSPRFLLPFQLLARVPAGIDAVLGAVAPEAEPDNRGDAQRRGGVSVRPVVQRARRGDGGGPNGG